MSPGADKFGRIEIGNNVFIGIGAIIMPGVRVGDNVVIGAGSVVTRDIRSNCVADGVPCKVLKTIDEYFTSLRDVVDFTKDMDPAAKETYPHEKYGESSDASAQG